MGVIPEITIALYYIAGWELCSASQSWLSTIVIVALLFRVAPLERCLRKPFIDSRQCLLALGSYVTRPMVDRELRIRRGAVRHDGAAMQQRTGLILSADDPMLLGFCSRQL